MSRPKMSVFLAAASLAAALVFAAPGAWADEKKTERPKEVKETPHHERQQPARENRPSSPVPPNAAPRSDPNNSNERRTNTPRDPRNDPRPPQTIDRSTGQERRNSIPANNPPASNSAPNHPQINNSRSNDRRNSLPSNSQQSNNPSSNDRNNRQGGFNGNRQADSSNRNGGNNNPGFTRNASGRPEAYRSSNGNEAHFRSDGRVQTVQGRGMLITHGNGDSRRIIVARPDRTIIVTNQSGHGYVQRPYVYRGQEFAQRTYFVKGRVYTSFYRPYVYGGISLNIYVPGRFYGPGFYGYVYQPWARPVAFRWGWYGDPWFGYYGGYFSPLPYYASPSLWLVDYIIAARLAESYQDRANAQASAYSQGVQQPLTPEIRQAIAAEVQAQLEAERSQSQAYSRDDVPDPAQGAVSQWFSDGRPHTFIVSFTLDVTDDRGQGCTVTRGDVLQLTQAPPQGSDTAYVRVVASKGPDCRTGSMVAVSLQDLQDIQNQMRESVNQGLGELQSKAGQNGLPTLPPNAQQGAAPAPFVQAAPPPDNQVAAELSAQVQEADKVEQEVLGEARQEDGTIPRPEGLVTRVPPPVAPPAEISLGQTIDEVVAAFGPPIRIAKLGPKTVYSYKDVKVTFMNGKVTDVQ